MSTTTQAQQEAQPVLSAQDVVGRWVSAAPEKIVNPDGSAIYGIRDFTLGQRDWSISFTAYGDEAASFPLFTLRAEGEYALGAESASVAGASEADFAFSARYLTAHAPMFVDLFTSAAAGSAPWQVGVEQDISATGAAFIPSVAQAAVEYDLLKLDGDQLYFGDRAVDLSTQRATQLIAWPVVRR